jgi:tetratricopeptide (TPR) repeat protein
MLSKREIDAGKKIERLLQESKWRDVISLARSKLRKDPEDHWYKASLGTALAELNRFSESRKVLMSAYESHPRCPLVLWELGSLALDSKKPRDAIVWFKKILAIDLLDLAFDECGEGMRSARSLSTDSMCGMGDAYARLHNRRQAIMWYKRHLESRTRGIPSVYDRREIENELAILQRGDWPSEE